MRSLSKQLLTTHGHGASTTSLGSLLQCLTTLTVNKCFLMSCLLCAISILPSAPSSRAQHSPLTALQGAVRSALALLFSRQPNAPWHSSEDIMPSALSPALLPVSACFQGPKYLSILLSSELHTIFETHPC